MTVLLNSSINPKNPCGKSSSNGQWLTYGPDSSLGKVPLVSGFFVLHCIRVQGQTTDVGRRHESEVEGGGGDAVQDSLLDLSWFLSSDQFNGVVHCSVNVLSSAAEVSKIFSWQWSHFKIREWTMTMNLVVFVSVFSPNLIMSVPPCYCCIRNCCGYRKNILLSLLLWGVVARDIYPSSSDWLISDPRTIL